MKCTPVILNSSKEEKTIYLDREKAIQLDRIEVQKNEEKDESWLQKLIFENPDLLPVDELGENFAPLIPVGREIPLDIPDLGTVYIDNLYISPQGKLTIVETKLWKNPDKHRTVVAQLIEYAVKISKWNYDDLNKAVIKSQTSSIRNEAKSLEQIVSPFLEERGILQETFEENVMLNLQSGEFLLLIVGDKISPNVTLLSKAIHSYPGLDFEIGLIELQLHTFKKGEPWPLLVISDVVGRTVKKTRGVITVKYECEEKKPKVEVSIVEQEDEIDKKTGSRQAPLPLEEFLGFISQSCSTDEVNFARTIIEESSKMGYKVDPKSSAYMIKLLDPIQNKKLITLFGIGKDGFINISWMAQQLESLGLSKEIAYDYAKDTAALFENCESHPKYPDSWTRAVKLNEVKAKYDDFIKILKATITRIKTEPRVEKE